MVGFCTRLDNLYRPVNMYHASGPMLSVPPLNTGIFLEENAEEDTDLSKRLDVVA